RHRLPRIHLRERGAPAHRAQPRFLQGHGRGERGGEARGVVTAGRWGFGGAAVRARRSRNATGRDKGPVDGTAVLSTPALPRDRNTATAASGVRSFAPRTAPRGDQRIGVVANPRGWHHHRTSDARVVHHAWLPVTAYR